MRILSAALILSLAACASQEASTGPRPIASAADPNALGPAPASAASKEIRSSSDIPPPPTAPGTPRPIQIDKSKRLEAVDIYVDTRDQNSMRQLVPYIIQSEEWVLVKSEYTSATTKHFRFQRVAIGKETIPMVDPFRASKSK